MTTAALHHSPATTSLGVERPSLWWAGLRKLKACFAGVPREEDRIFLFLDLNSSTMLAEELGHIRYSELLKCCFADLALSVKKYKATVYQYVGDEAVLSWGGHLPAEGVALFFDFENRLRKRASFYKNRFGRVPTFKASIHGGEGSRYQAGRFPATQGIPWRCAECLCPHAGSLPQDWFAVNCIRARSKPFGSFRSIHHSLAR